MLKEGTENGSKVIITTRDPRVAQIAGAVGTLELNPLTEVDCWSIFKSNAFNTNNTEEANPQLVSIGREIVKKYSGIPLASVCLGATLLGKDESEWKSVRDKELSELHKKWCKENIRKILFSLKLTYLQMPYEQKLCFAYCSIFPSEYEIDENKLIEQWHALEFLKSIPDNMRKYLKELISASFLLYDKQHKKSERKKCKMQILAYHLARLIATDVAIISKHKRAKKTGSQEYRYATLIGYKDEKLSSTLCQTLGKVRALQFRDCENIKFPKNIFSTLPNLQVLQLGEISQLRKLPNSIKKMKQLRYLDVSNFQANQFCKLDGSLRNLQFLYLSNSTLEHLPGSICNLTNLLSLDLSNCSSLKSLPQAIRRLSNMQHLDLSNCPQLDDSCAIIGGLHSLCSLNLSGCSLPKILTQILSQLQNLEYLNLSHWVFVSLPETIGNLQNLHTLNLSCCSHLQTLPTTIANNKSLQHINLSECERLESLPDCLANLVNLQLDLSDCTSLKELPQRILELHGLILPSHLKESLESRGNLHSHITNVDAVDVEPEEESTLQSPCPRENVQEKDMESKEATAVKSEEITMQSPCSRGEKMYLQRTRLQW